MKLGKLAPRFDRRTLRLAKYLPSNFQPKPSITWSTKVVSWPMYGNDIYGDCTTAGVGHGIQLWTSNASTEVVIPEPEILKAYSAIGGFIPGNPATDQGCVELDVLNYWRNFGIGGYKIESYVAVTPGAIDHVQVAIELFGGVYIGVALPQIAQTQETWGVGGSGSSEPGSWGGHCVIVCDYDQDGLTVVTWGALKKVTWEFWRTYCDECYAILSPDWLANGHSPAGLDLTALQEDLQKISA